MMKEKLELDLRTELADAINKNKYLANKFDILDKELIERARKNLNGWHYITTADLDKINATDPKVTMLDYYDHLVQKLDHEIVTWLPMGRIMINVSKLTK